jgi:small GTP-binding protein
MELREYKVIIVGDFAVGKTSLLNAFNGMINCHSLPTHIPTSATRRVLTSMGEEIQIQFWDTAGDERYQQLIPLFTRDTDLAIVCFLPQTTASALKWISNVREFSPDALFVGAITKADLIESDSGKIREAENEARELQYKNGLIAVHLTSSRAGSPYFQEIGTLLGTAFDNLKPPSRPPSLPPPPTKRPCC